MNAITKREIVTPDELATQLRIKRTTVFQWVREGKIPAVKMSRRIVRFDLTAVLSALGVL